MYIGYNPIETGLGLWFIFLNSSHSVGIYIHFYWSIWWLTLRLLVRISMTGALNVDIKTTPGPSGKTDINLCWRANSGHYYFDDSRLHNDRAGCTSSFYHYCPFTLL